MNGDTIKKIEEFCAEQGAACYAWDTMTGHNRLIVQDSKLLFVVVLRLPGHRCTWPQSQKVKEYRYNVGSVNAAIVSSYEGFLDAYAGAIGDPPV